MTSTSLPSSTARRRATQERECRRRRREMRRPENGYEVLERIKEELSDLIRLERDAGPLEGRDLTMVLAPGRKTA